MYRDCKECGAKCCKFFGIPFELENLVENKGVPLDKYNSPLERDPENYFKHRVGVKIAGECFTIDNDIPRKVMNTRLDKYVIVYSQCRELTEDGRCGIYENRPEMCRNFVPRTACKYLVPEGCIFDTGEHGEDFGL